jgi:hypothetical protein
MNDNEILNGLIEVRDLTDSPQTYRILDETILRIMDLKHEVVGLKLMVNELETYQCLA